jgi:hypothetical protein
MGHVVISRNGPLCPRCRRATEIREHDRLGPKQLRQPFYYKRWFCCTYGDCKTTMIMRPEFEVWKDSRRRQQFRRIRAYYAKKRARENTHRLR